MKEITYDDLKQRIDNGAKKKELAEHYGLSVNQMTKALQEAGLKIRGFHHPKFKIVGKPQQIVESVEIAQEIEIDMSTVVEPHPTHELREEPQEGQAGW